MNKKIAENMRLTDNNPTAIKLSQLCELADKLGISLHYSNQRVILEDRDRDRSLPPLYLEDIEDNHWFQEFPPTTEYKLVYKNPEFLAQRKREHEEYEKQKEEQARLDREKQAAKAKVEAERRAKEIEKLERSQLAMLRKKYGE